MGILNMVEKGFHCSDLLELPLFYMNDYSVMGLMVPQLTPAVQALSSRGFHVETVEIGARIEFNGPQEVSRIFDALSAEQITFTVTDLVDQAYQG